MESNSGPASARNVGWNKATQSYLAFLDADDNWHPRKVELQLNWMLANPDVNLTGRASRVYRNISDLESIPTFSQGKKIKVNDMLWSNRFCTRDVMLKR